jgi:NAD(P)H-hydrate epimerase
LFCADGEIYVNGTGNERLAKGGSGDKLTGLIAGYLAQGLKAKHAAICGMFELIEFA